MSFALNEQNIEILMEVREKLRLRLVDTTQEWSDGTQYICIQVLHAFGRRCGVEKAHCSSDLTNEMLLKYSELTEAINAALGFRTSVGTYLIDLPLSGVRMWQIFDEIAPLARLAWLDRMIETKVIA